MNTTKFNCNTYFILFFLIASFFYVEGQETSLSKPVWVSDNADGTYSNPIIAADYSDPDVIRVEDKFYMTASSFNCIPYDLGLYIPFSRFV